MACPVGTPQSVANADLLWPGFWSRLVAIIDPLGLTTGPTEQYLGNVTDGTLRIEREETEFLGTTFPQLVEAVYPTKISMQFAGQANEIRAKLLHFIVGDESIASENAFIYPGAGCAFGDIDVGIVGERENCAGNCIDFRFWKGRASGATEIGGAAEVIGMPLEINALNDINGDFGGSTSAPLGFIHFSALAI